YQRESSEFQPFSSKYDAYLAGKTQLTAAEMRGLKLFNETEALTMPDGIHPDAAGYRTIAANFVEHVPKAWLGA
ncbi:MAG: hypothetical protein RLZZ340_107, partial [Actinomycetota bacterium]